MFDFSQNLFIIVFPSLSMTLSPLTIVTNIIATHHQSSTLSFLDIYTLRWTIIIT